MTKSTDNIASLAVKTEKLHGIVKILDSTEFYMDKNTTHPWIKAGDLGYMNLATHKHCFEPTDLDLLEIGRAGFLLSKILTITKKRLDEKA